MDNSNFPALVISGLVSVLTIFGVRVFDYISKRSEALSKQKGKEFDDGVERRKELMREIEEYKKTIVLKDSTINDLYRQIDKLKDDIRDNAILYTKLDLKYREALHDLAHFSKEMAARFDAAAGSADLEHLSNVTP